MIFRWKKLYSSIVNYFLTVNLLLLSLQCNRRIKFGKLALKCKGNILLSMPCESPLGQFLACLPLGGTHILVSLRVSWAKRRYF